MLEERMDFDFSDFAEMEFPQHKEIVYVLYFSDESGREVPLYVGESLRGVRRFGDYISAKFSAPTDFKVGEAVRYLQSRGFKVRIKYKESEDRKGEERKIVSILRRKSRLLNELEGFSYTASNEEAERTKLYSFLEIMTQERGIRTDGISTGQPRQEAKRVMALSTEEIHVDKIRKSFSSGAGNTNRTIIEGRITSQGIYKTDNKDICELYINKDGADALPHECGKKEPVSLVIGEIAYEAGVHETQEGVVWVSSVLKKRAGREKARLVDALEEIGLKKGDKITLKKNAEGIFILSGSERP
ncbi:MAG: hypothetical protein JW725_05320 [Candidatus Babeliaceae bacterium]|nr:hypothetical protein [Candidatus Babeliaceae bacterium]